MTIFDPPQGTSPGAAADPLPLQVKAGLGSGESFWHTKSAAGLPALILTDGPHGVRLQPALADHLGLAHSAPATCFPPAAGLAQSWDRELVARVGRELADEVTYPFGYGLSHTTFRYDAAMPDRDSLGTEMLKMIESIPVGRLKLFGITLSREVLDHLLQPDP